MKVSPFKTILVFLVLMTVGFAMTPLLTVKLQSTETINSVTVSYNWYSASGRVIEQEVTSVLEATFSRLRGVSKVSSSSANGYGSITVDFNESVDFDAARFEISTLIRQAYPAFPKGVSYPQVFFRRPDNESVKPLLSYTLNAPVSPVLIQRYVENHLKPALSNIEGVSKIEVYGANPMEWMMQYNVELMKNHGISASDIQNAVNKHLMRYEIGLAQEDIFGIGANSIPLYIQNYQPDSVELARIPIKAIGAQVVYLADVVKIHYQEEVHTAYFRINGANTVNLVIYADEYVNQLNVSEKVKSKLTNIAAKLPPSYFLLLDFDATELISNELSKNIKRSIITVLILLLFVFVVTRRLSYLLLIIISLIANLSLAVILYRLFRIEISLYSFAGITVSLGMMLENCIVMIDYYQRYRNRKIFLVTLATTVTTAIALLSVHFLETQVRLNLLDFSVIISINLLVSLFVSLFLMPALLEKIGFNPRHPKLKNTTQLKFKQIKLSQITLGFYKKILIFILRFRKSFITFSVLLFGLPLFLLPPLMESGGKFATFYNQTLGNTWYTDNVKPVIDVVTGGILRLFVQDVYQKSGYREIAETSLFVNAELPHGATVEQMNDLFVALERYLSGFKEIKQFRTSIHGASYGQITIYFKKDYSQGSFPYMLKDELIRKANDLGGADWTVYGVGDGFNNSVKETLGYSRIKLYGFNYDELYFWAERVKAKLLENMRIKDVSILSRDAWAKDLSFEFVMELDRENLIVRNGNPYKVFNSLKIYDANQNNIAAFVGKNGIESIRLTPNENQIPDVWAVNRIANRDNEAKSMEKLYNISNIKKEYASPDIVRENQQYVLILAYDYIGSNELGQRIQDNLITETRKVLPLGYTIEGNQNFYFWDQESHKHYLILLLIIIASFFVCTILFESFLQPLFVLYMIPFGYIGLFLTFILFDFNFDQGGFAAFVLLSGLTINAALYIIHEYDLLSYRFKGKMIDPIHIYIKALSNNIRTVFIIVFSICLGLTPFLFGERNEVFWPALAAGTIGGMLFSLIGVLLFLPIVVLGSKRRRKSLK